MTYTQTQWAKQHDWYHSSCYWGTDYVVYVRDDGPAGDIRSFTNYEALRSWAGY